eukprot:CAMPEP_0197075030 /NCGR_PEP_ID=MMETSP1384-20130603/211407_1 /TAXON_ID=29189 /ORGANISM="Ammonia sp." /LENGTH=227 /DNA_ID=CAMNT_0042513873 /DNA_START=627 /DNA_END=1310 /DNA_ORIENTATION=-
MAIFVYKLQQIVRQCATQRHCNDPAVQHMSNEHTANTILLCVASTIHILFYGAVLVDAYTEYSAWWILMARAFDDVSNIVALHLSFKSHHKLYMKCCAKCHASATMCCLWPITTSMSDIQHEQADKNHDGASKEVARQNTTCGQEEEAEPADPQNGNTAAKVIAEGVSHSIEVEKFTSMVRLAMSLQHIDPDHTTIDDILSCMNYYQSSPYDCDSDTTSSEETDFVD